MADQRTDLVDVVGATDVGGEPIASGRQAAALDRALHDADAGRRPRVAPGTVCLFSDVVCGWATVALHRVYRARAEIDPDATVRVDHRPFLLEDVNCFAVPKRYLDAEIPVLGALAPELGWSEWQGLPETWPVSSALANEAVQAAKRQSLAAAEELDWALRMAFFRDSICITLRHEVERVARTCGSLDVGRLLVDLDDGAARRTMWSEYRLHRNAVQGSPHFFLSDGSDEHNPGVEFHWNGEPGRGFPVVDDDDPGALHGLLERALRTCS